MNWLTEELKKKAYRSVAILSLLFLGVSVMDSCEKDKENANLLNNLSA